MTRETRDLAASSLSALVDMLDQETTQEKALAELRRIIETHGVYVVRLIPPDGKLEMALYRVARSASNREVRKRAIIALGNLPTPLSLDCLLLLKKEVDDSLLWVITEALGTITSKFIFLT